MADAQGMAERAAEENFPVALRILSSRLRGDLMAAYAFARKVDDLGDEPDALDLPPGADPGAAVLAALEHLDTEIDLAAAGMATDPVMVGIGRLMGAHSLSTEPFHRLVQANRVDQTKTRYATFEDLMGYCELSANPVGEIVLGIFGEQDPSLAGPSNDICSALQIIEHLQDVGEDARRGRIYLPTRDMARLGVEESDLLAQSATPALRRAVALLAGRATVLLGSSGHLLPRLRPMARMAVGGFVAGGLSALRAIEQARFDTLAGSCRPSKRAWVASFIGLEMAAMTGDRIDA